MQELRPIETLRGESADVALQDGGPPEPPQVTLSIGVAELSIGDDATAWITRADRALSRSRRAGRDTVSTAVHGDAHDPATSAAEVGSDLPATR